MYKAKRPFSYRGTVDKGNGEEQFNGVVKSGWRLICSNRKGDRLVKQRLAYKTKEEKKAYIVHSGGSWFEVRYGSKTEKVQGKDNAEQLRDQWNAENS